MTKFLYRLSKSTFLSLILLGLAAVNMAQEVPIIQPGAPGEEMRNLSAEEAIEIANDTPYGLAAYIQTGDKERAKRVAARLRAGMIQVNGASRAAGSPFGGYKQSGVGREGGFWGIEEFLEIKTISGIV